MMLTNTENMGKNEEIIIKMGFMLKNIETEYITTKINMKR